MITSTFESFFHGVSKGCVVNPVVLLVVAMELHAMPALVCYKFHSTIETLYQDNFFVKRAAFNVYRVKIVNKTP